MVGKVGEQRQCSNKLLKTMNNLQISFLTSNLPGRNKASSMRSGLLVIPAKFKESTGCVIQAVYQKKCDP